MAQKVITLIQTYDDIDGTLIPDGEGENLTYVWDGHLYEIDLSTAHATEIRQHLKPLLDASRKVGRVPTKSLLPSRAKQPQKKSTPAVETPEPPALPGGTAWSSEQARREFFREIREWALTNGFPDQSLSGKLRDGLREAWNAAHPDRPAPEPGEGTAYKRRNRELRESAVPVD